MGCLSGMAELAWGVLWQIFVVCFLSGVSKKYGMFSQDVLSYIYTMDLPQSIVSYQKEEYITTQRVNSLPVPIPCLT